MEHSDEQSNCAPEQHRQTTKMMTVFVQHHYVMLKSRCCNKYITSQLHPLLNTQIILPSMLCHCQLSFRNSMLYLSVLKGFHDNLLEPTSDSNKPENKYAVLTGQLLSSYSRLGQVSKVPSAECRDFCNKFLLKAEGHSCYPTKSSILKKRQKMIVLIAYILGHCRLCSLALHACRYKSVMEN